MKHGLVGADMQRANCEAGELRRNESRLAMPHNGIDAILAWNDAGRRSGVFVNATAQPCGLNCPGLDAGLAQCTQLLWMDRTTQGHVARRPFDGAVSLDGYGLAVVTNASDTVVD